MQQIDKSAIVDIVIRKLADLGYLNGCSVEGLRALRKLVIEEVESRQTPAKRGAR